MPTDKKSLLFALLLTGIYIALVQVLQGSFFEDYEVLIHQFILGNGSGRPYSVWVTDMDFGLIAVYARLQDFCSGISVYSIAKTLFVWLGLSTIVYLILAHFKAPFRSWLLLIVGLVFMDDVVMINNVRIAALLSVAGLLTLYLAGHLSDTKRIGWAVVLLLLAVLNRIEIPVIFITLGIIPAVFLRLRSVWLPLGIVWLLALGNLKLYDYLMHQEHPRIVHFHNYERALYDRADFVLGDLAAYPVALDSQQLVFLAKMLFVLDEEKLDYEQFPEIVGHPGVLDYLTNNSRLIGIWIGKNIELLDNLLLNYPLKLLCLLLGVILWWAFSPGRWWWVLFSSLAFLATPLFLNLLYITPDRFISPYVNIGVIALSIVLAKNLSNRPTKWDVVAFTLVIPLLIHWHLRANGIYSELQERERSALTVMELFKKDEAADRPAVLYCAQTLKMLPAKLHHTNAGVNWYFLDANIFNYYEHSGAHNAAFFADTYPNFSDRVEKLCQENLPLYADEMFIAFVKFYMERVHHKEISILKVANVLDDQVGLYQVNCH